MTFSTGHIGELKGEMVGISTPSLSKSPMTDCTFLVPCLSWYCGVFITSTSRGRLTGSQQEVLTSSIKALILLHEFTSLLRKSIKKSPNNKKMDTPGEGQPG